MADPTKSEASAEKAYAAAAEGLTPGKAPTSPVAAETPAVEPEAVVEPAPAVEAPVDVAPAVAAPAAKPAARKPVAKKAPVKKPVAKKAAAKPAAKPSAPKPAPAPAPVAKTKSTPKPVAKSPVVKARRKVRTKPAKPAVAAVVTHTITELKEKIMATKSTDFTAMMSKSMSDAVSEMQSKAQAAYDKGTGMVADMTEMAKGNVEALVESGKIMASGMQDMGKTVAEDAKSAYETMTADLKEMAAVKSPTELFQLQGKIMRRNFDAMVAATSKGTESSMKLANDVFAPISARVNLAVEKFSKAA